MIVFAPARWACSIAGRGAFYERIKHRRGFQIAVVATARKLTVLCWHHVINERDYAFARPRLVAFYTDKQLRRHEREIVKQAEHAYANLVAHWQPRPRDRKPDGVLAAVKAKPSVDRTRVLNVGSRHPGLPG